MGDITRYERRLLSGRTYADPRVNAARGMRRRLSWVRYLLAAALVVAVPAGRLGSMSVAVAAVVAVVAAAGLLLFHGHTVRDRLHASPVRDLAWRTAHVRALGETASVQRRPCRRELDRVMTATRAIDRSTRRVLRREARALADRARRLHMTAVHAGVAVAELPTRADGAIRWSARPQIVAGADGVRWAAYDAAMRRIHERLVDIHRAAAGLQATGQPAVAVESRIHALDAQLAQEEAIAEIEDSTSALDPVTAIHDRLAAEQFAHDRLAELRRLR